MYAKRKDFIRWASIIWLSVLFFAFTNSVSAQEVRGSITGQVTDPQGAVISGANVTMTNVATNIKSTTTTNDEGRYTILYLSLGTYSLTVEAPGYKKIVHNDIQVQVEDKLTLNVTLEIGSVNETVNVTSDSTVLNTGDGSVGQVIDSRMVSELPTPDGNAFLLTRLGTGIADISDPRFTRPHDMLNTADTNANGVRRANEFTIDNAPNSGISDRAAYIPPVDAVQEFKVVSFSTSAAQGHFGGATINVSTKSGQNDLFGTLHYFSRNDKLSANNFFNNRNGLPRPVLRYHRFGGTVGGPVFLPRFGEGGPALYKGHDRTFFFFAYEGLNDIVPNPRTVTVPTLAQRNGDFSALLGDQLVDQVRANGCAGPNGTTVLRTNADGSPALRGQIYDPLSTRRVSRCNPTTGRVEERLERLPFRGNIIPQDRLHSISRNILRYMPLPNQGAQDAEGRGNFYSQNPEKTDYQSQTIRIDHHYTSNQNGFLRFTRSHRDNLRQIWSGEVNGIIPSGQAWNRDSLGVTYDHVYVINPTLVLNTRAGYSYAADDFTVPSRGGIDLVGLGFSPDVAAAFPASDYFPRVNITGYESLGSALPGKDKRRVYSAQSILSKSFNNHTFSMGYEFRHYRDSNGSNQNSAGLYSFSDTFMRGPIFNSPAQHGQGMAAFLLGVAGGSVDIIPAAKLEQYYHGIFVQDDWKITPKLTLNLGIRYEYEGAIQEKYNRAVRNVDLNMPTSASFEEAVRQRLNTLYPNPSTRPINIPPLRGGFIFADEQNRALLIPEKKRFMPRLGFAYQLNKETVLRGGFTTNIGPLGLTGLRQSGFTRTTNLVNSPAEGIYGCPTCGTLDNPYPQGIQLPIGSNQGVLGEVGSSLGDVLNLVGQERRASRIYMWNIGIQRQLPGKLVVEAYYIGNRNVGRRVMRNINATPREYLSTSPLRDVAAINRLDQTINNPFRGTLPATNTSSHNTSSTLRFEQLIVPYPHFGSISVPSYDGWSSYHSGQLRVQKRLSEGVSGLFTYTWAKLMTKSSLLNSTDAEYEKVIGEDDVPHRITAAGIFELPFGKKRRWGADMPGVIDAVLGGWQLGATYVWQMGTPMGFGNRYFNGDLGQLRAKINSKSVVPTAGERAASSVSPNVFNNIFGIDLRNSGFYLTDAQVRTNGELDFSRQFNDERINLDKNIRTMPSRFSWLRGQSRNNLDLSLMKKFFFGEKTHLQLRCEMINATNYVLFQAGDIGPNLNPRNQNFGTVSEQANTPRFFQLGAKLVF
jgi:hypothetical protein